VRQKEKNMKEITTLNVKIDSEDKKALIRIAKDKDLTLSQLVRRMAAQYIKKYESAE
jgi:antitoxin component of RelBE/YafQ-DinJ toxin-antitoxin module